MVFQKKKSHVWLHFSIEKKAQMCPRFNESEWKMIVSQNYSEPGKIEYLASKTSDPVHAMKLAENWMDDKLEAEIQLFVLALVPWFLLSAGRDGRVTAQDVIQQVQKENVVPVPYRERVVSDVLSWRNALY